MSDDDDITRKLEELADGYRAELDVLEAELDALDVKPGPKTDEHKELMQRVGTKRKQWRQAEALAGRRPSGFAVVTAHPPSD